MEPTTCKLYVFTLPVKAVTTYKLPPDIVTKEGADPPPCRVTTYVIGVVQVDWDCVQARTDMISVVPELMS